MTKTAMDNNKNQKNKQKRGLSEQTIEIAKTRLHTI